VPAGEVLAVPELVLASGALPAPERVLVVGRPTLSRAVGRLVSSSPADVVGSHGRWPDPSRSAGRALAAVPAPAGGGIDAAWLRAWQDAGRRAQAAVDRVLAGTDGLPEPLVARAVLDAAQRERSPVVVGSSMPVRDAFLAGPRDGVRVLANRGAAGIDGTVSTAVGVALSTGPAYALLGDLTFLHDANGLVLGPAEPRPDLTLVVVNNDGGEIFGLLEQGGPQHGGAFERVFGTPHGVDLASLCAATGTGFTRVGAIAELGEARAAVASALTG
jgi:2-succinyl-5-enolpyruvyl-6-hydroxy-3-cyclohexene-1-carboxylate synthase